jgi:hypothetical protein
LINQPWKFKVWKRILECIPLQLVALDIDGWSHALMPENRAGCCLARRGTASDTTGAVIMIHD